MVNWKNEGKTWPRPHPLAVGLLQGLIWEQHYRQSNPQREGGFPETLELREDLGGDRLQALADWLQVEGYGYRFRQRRWRVWRLNPRAGEGLCPAAYEDEVHDIEYRHGQRINVSIWDVIEKEFREPGQERKLRKSPSDKKRSSGDKKRDKKWKEFQDYQAAQARALVPIGEATTPERPRFHLRQAKMPWVMCTWARPKLTQPLSHHPHQQLPLHPHHRPVNPPFGAPDQFPMSKNAGKGQKNAKGALGALAISRNGNASSWNNKKNERGVPSKR